ncbi:hypothetical protein CR513_21672, partial [Mucuna pruriens]
METSKQHLVRFNATMVQVDDLDKKIKARAKKHVVMEEDKGDRLQVEKAMLAVKKKSAHGFQANH